MSSPITPLGQIGTHTADLPHVFVRFHRADRSRSRGTGGTGLGLPITRANVEAHGGHNHKRRAWTGHDRRPSTSSNKEGSSQPQSHTLKDGSPKQH